MVQKKSLQVLFRYVEMPCRLFASCHLFMLAWLCAAFTSSVCVALPNADAVWMDIPASPPNLDAVFPPFDHVPYQQASFSPLVLPFKCDPGTAENHRFEANALSFLISFDLDWVPTNHSGRHASFISERDATTMKSLASNYDARLIRQAMDRWLATVAIGGTLHFTDAGVSASVKLFDRSANVTWTKDFAAEDFFQLLGDIDANVMRQVGYEPPPALISYLRQPRCTRQESIAAFGQTAYEPRAQMLQELADLLQKDPTFGDVHAWWANQYAWTDRFSTQSYQQKVLALNDHLTAGTLPDIDASPDTDPDILSMYKKCVARASDIAGPDAPVVLSAELNIQRFARGNADDLVRRALPVIARYPNASSLLYEVSSALLQTGDVDASLAGSIAVVDNDNLFDPGVGDRRTSRDVIARALKMAGRPDLQLSELQRADVPSTFYRADRLHALLCTGHWQQVIDDLTQSPLKVSTSNVDSACLFVVAAALAGDDDRVRQLREQWSVPFTEQNFAPVVDVYLNAERGKPFTAEDIKIIFQVPSGDSFYCADCLFVLADQKLNTGLMPNTLLNDAQELPADRLHWILIDQYIRQIGYPHGAAFYGALAWLFPDDAWVQKAAAAFALRTATQPTTRSAADILTWQRSQLDKLETPDAKAKRTSAVVNGTLHGWLAPYNVAYSVHNLLEIHDVKSARSLASRFHDLVLSSRSVELRAWAKMMLDRTNS